MSQAVLERIEAQAAPPINRSWPKRFMSRPEVAEYTGIAASTINNLHHIGQGPKMIKVGGRVIYALEDVHEWLDSFKVDPAARCKPSEPEAPAVKRGRGRPRKEAK